MLRLQSAGKDEGAKAGFEERKINCCVSYERRRSGGAAEEPSTESTAVRQRRVRSVCPFHASVLPWTIVTLLHVSYRETGALGQIGRLKGKCASWCGVAPLGSSAKSVILVPSFPQI